jgi:predicted lipoprotein with Yx(FWY)xxD motif
MAAPAATASPDTVRIADTSLGKILADSSGRSLYYFTDDTAGSGASACSGQCAVVWPIFFADPVRVSAPLDPADFSTITRADGSKQTTYSGWPLYYFQQDVNPGDVKGEDVMKVWYVMKPDENILIARTKALGSYLTDGSGRTLYYFAREAPGSAACTGACLQRWPAFLAAGTSAPSVLNTADFSAAKRTDGITQTAYKGRMLYYFADDTAPGDAKGQGFNGVWYVANITGSVPPTPAPTTIPTTRPTIDYGSDSGGGGGGY